MRIVNMPEDDNVRDFAKKAAMFLEEHDDCHTFVNMGIEAGELFVLRFGPCDNCVLVFRIDEDFGPINY